MNRVQLDDGSLILRYHRENSVSVLLVSFFLTHYLLYTIPVFAAMFLWYHFVVKGVVFWAGLTLYLATLVICKPHQTRSWAILNPLTKFRVFDKLKNYYGSSMIREGPAPDPEKRYIFAVSSHGILAVFRGLWVGTVFGELFPGIDGHWAGATAQFLVPFGCRETMLFFQAIDASYKVLAAAFAAGRSLFLIPGGTREIATTDGSSKTTSFCFADRLGFIRLALAEGADIIPAVAFGEKWCYSKYELPFAGWLYDNLKLPGTLFFGRGGTLLPKLKRPNGEDNTVGVVFGRPISCGAGRAIQRGDAGFDARVAEVHEAYCGEMRRIFEQYKTEFRYDKDEKLDICNARPKKDQ